MLALVRGACELAPDSDYILYHNIESKESLVVSLLSVMLLKQNWKRCFSRYINIYK